MYTAAAVLLGMAGAGLMGSAPVASILCFVGAYYVGRWITLGDLEAFSGLGFALAVAGFGAGFF